MAGPVLLCYDGSDGAKRAVERAAELVGPGPAIVLQVWSGSAGYPPEALSPELYEELDRAASERAEKLAEEGRALAAEAGFDARAVVHRAPSTWRAIIETADQEDVAAIVIGARGLSAIKAAILGSVSSAVAHHSDRALLIVPDA